MLMAHSPPWRQQQHKKMRCMPDLKSRPAQALWWFTILASSYSLLERFVNRFYHWSTNFDGLKRRQLRLNLCLRQSAHKNGSLRANQGYHQCPRPCWGFYQHSSEVWRPPGLNYHQMGFAIHLKVLVITMLFPWHQAKTFHRLPPPDGRADQRAK